MSCGMAENFHQLKIGGKMTQCRYKITRANDIASKESSPLAPPRWSVICQLTLLFPLRSCSRLSTASVPPKNTQRPVWSPATHRPSTIPTSNWGRSFRPRPRRRHDSVGGAARTMTAPSPATRNAATTTTTRQCIHPTATRRFTCHCWVSAINTVSQRQSGSCN